VSVRGDPMGQVQPWLTRYASALRLTYGCR
jgi:hypothetical protein